MIVYSRGTVNVVLGLTLDSRVVPKRIYCIEAQEMGKNVALILKSSFFEGIFIDAKGVNCASLEIVHAKKYFM